MTGRMINVGGIPIMTPNDIANEKTDYYISYNTRDIGIYGDVTTSLVLKDPLKFLILNGNHVEQYNQIISSGGGCVDCVNYFKANQSLKAKYSENWDELMIFKDGKLTVVKDDTYVDSIIALQD